MGGGFGGKEDMSVQHHAALITYVTHLPVKVKLSRAESLLVHPKRHPFWMDFTIGCDENGIIQGVQAEVVSDTGAFASLGGPRSRERACTHAAGPYAYENFEIKGRAYYTNNPPAGAFRGFGVTQTCFAIESLLNEMAEKIGISPWESATATRSVRAVCCRTARSWARRQGFVETLEAVKPAFDEAVKAGKPVGLACAMKNAGVGVGLPDYGRCKLIVEEDEKLHIYAGASCIGQGLGTVLVQMCVTSTPLSRDQIVYERSNTWIAPTPAIPRAPPDAHHGRSVPQSVRKVLRGIRGRTMEGPQWAGVLRRILRENRPLGADKPNPVSHVAYGYATQMCILDKKTGKLEKIVAAHDVGKAVNPRSCEGQIEGGVVMSMGYALREQYPIDENCKPIDKYGKLGLFRAHEIPQIDAIVIDKPGLDVACGPSASEKLRRFPPRPRLPRPITSMTTSAGPFCRLHIRRMKGRCEYGCQKRFPYKAALVACNGGCRATADCEYGCVACGLCVGVCKFDAIEINSFGVAQVNEGKCIACGACVRECPRELIHIHECANPIVVKCSNKDLGKNARKYCEVSCIGCGLCEKACPAGAITVTENLSHIEESICLSCGQCAVKCPRGAIVDLRGILTD